MDTITQQRNPLEGWPSRGYTGPQPWEHAQLGIPRQLLDEVRDHPGTENNVTPQVTHHLPILTSGSADPCVHDLGRKLGRLGFPNSVSEGNNPFGHVDGTVLTAVKAFRRQYGVRTDPSSFGGDQETADNHLDPWTVEAILRAQP